MSVESNRDQLERSTQNRSAQSEEELSRTQTEAADEGGQYSQSLMSSPSLGGRGNGSARAAAMQRAQQTHGNHAVQRAVQRSADTSASSEDVSIQRFTEPAPWLGHGGRHSDWNGMPTGPNIGIEPANPGAGWAQAPHTPAPQIDNPMFPGGGPFFNPTPGVGDGGGGGLGGLFGGLGGLLGGGGGSSDPGGFNPFFNPTPSLPSFGGGGGGGDISPMFGEGDNWIM